MKIAVPELALQCVIEEQTMADNVIKLHVFDPALVSPLKLNQIGARQVDVFDGKILESKRCLKLGGWIGRSVWRKRRIVVVVERWKERYSCSRHRCHLHHLGAVARAVVRSVRPSTQTLLAMGCHIRFIVQLVDD